MAVAETAIESNVASVAQGSGMTQGSGVTQRLPDFMIIGAMKSMTSTLHNQLACQDGVYMSELKEPNFFSDDSNYSKGIDSYCQLFMNASVNELCGESSTHYSKLPTYPSCVSRIHDACPDVKLIYVMRHPVQRLVSHYVHAWTEAEIFEPIDDAVHNNSELVEYGLYDRQLEPYFASFSPSQILPVFYDRLKDQPELELRRIAKFIGLEGEVQWDHELDSQNASADRLKRNRLRDLIVEAPVLSTIRRQLVPKNVRNRIKSFWQMRDRPQLSSQNLQWLESVFDPSLSRLGKWLGVELNCENFCKVTLDLVPEWGDVK